MVRATAIADSRITRRNRNRRKLFTLRKQSEILKRRGVCCNSEVLLSDDISAVYEKEDILRSAAVVCRLNGSREDKSTYRRSEHL